MVGELSVGFTSLESSRPWLVYWCVHGLDVLGELEGDTATKQSAIAALRLCLHEDGGFKGNVTGEPHLATTYAAIVSIAAVNTDEGYSLVDRKLLHSFLMKMKQPDGSFLMHKGGETDVRGAFCALSTAVLCGICSDDLRKGVGDYIRTCQTYEGGFGGEPGNEAHGGYAFCAFAALRLIGEETSVDLNALAKWAVGQQMRLEGGFRGRTNKLVDACYSLWQGGLCVNVSEALVESSPDVAFRLAHAAFDAFLMHENSVWVESEEAEEGEEDEEEDLNGLAAAPRHPWLFQPVALENYSFCASQLQNGGFRDKPGKGRDAYHTCYSLSGLSLALEARQMCSEVRSSALAYADRMNGEDKNDERSSRERELGVVLGVAESNLLRPVDPKFVLVRGRAEAMISYFSGQ
eukprot:CAMPEP_0113868838 /NCGR_PEP_ID=MMETSP0780_2-20120614/1212_1 /TAXON_ID=652834 /ORGANISM="Palpitomonas bilix" /LENGTH=405 /DNA_ID=CAMNT_0000853967 /DNA_START=256 /DNA_END=1473 /DNA_ORIENTATION=+ /assembly_acc=CAM_ASM_000599